MTTIKLDTSILDKIRKELPEKTQVVGRKMAFRVEYYAKQYAPIETGTLRNSIYTVTQISDGFGAAAKSPRRKKGAAAVEFERHPSPSGHIIANVGPCVQYAEYQEFGTSRMKGKPYMIPAVERVENEFMDPKNWEAIIS